MPQSLVSDYERGYDFALECCRKRQTFTDYEQLTIAIDAIAEIPHRRFATGFLECINREIKRGAIKVVPT